AHAAAQVRAVDGDESLGTVARSGQVRACADEEGARDAAPAAGAGAGRDAQAHREDARLVQAPSEEGNVGALTAPLPVRLEELAAAANPPAAEARAAVAELLAALAAGTVRAAERRDGRWEANAWVRRGILLAFRVGALSEQPSAGPLRFFDKDTLPLASLTKASGVRIVPGGTSIRAGAFVAPGVTIMPPAFVNV